MTPSLGGDTDEERETPRTGHLTVIRETLPYLWPKDRADLRWRVVAAIIGMLLAKVVTVTVPFFYKGAVDQLSAEAAALAAPVLLVVGYGVTRFLMGALQQVRDAFFASVSQFAQRMLSVRTFDHLHKLSLRFHLERRTGGLQRIIERGTRALDFLLRFSLFSIVPTLIELAMVSAILFYLFGFSYALVTAVTVLGYVWFTFAVTEWRVKLRRQMNDSDNDANTKAVDSLLNFETVKYFGAEGHEGARFDQAAKRYEGAAVRTMVSLALLNIGQAVIFSVGLTVLMLMSGYAVASGTQTVGDFVMINTYLIQLAVPLNMIGFVYREIKQALVDMERMFDVLGEAPEIEDDPDAKPLTVTGGEVRFEGVGFHYEVRRPILKDVSFTVPAGRTVAVVGPSGAGKSTLSRILFRFYDISEGRVLIDGQDLRTVTQTSLRSAVGMVPQDTVLFNDTIRYNIRYGRVDASDAEVEEAAKLAQIHDFVLGLPDGYDTIVGERGLKLSGGEKQRVAIARTILKNPPILILDEATSALDSHTEQEIQTALREVSRARTTIVIAHRLSTIVDADEILVLEAGRIVERGTHQALLAKEGAYAAMWARQQEMAEAEERLKRVREAEAAEERAAELQGAAS